MLFGKVKILPTEKKKKLQTICGCESSLSKVFSPGQKRGVKSKQKSVYYKVSSTQREYGKTVSESLILGSSHIFHNTQLSCGQTGEIDCPACTGGATVTAGFTLLWGTPTHSTLRSKLIIKVRSADTDTSVSLNIYVCVWAFRGGVRETQTGGNGSHKILATDVCFLSGGFLRTTKAWRRKC